MMLPDAKEISMRANRYIWRSAFLMVLVASITVASRAQTSGETKTADIKKTMDAHDYRQALRMVTDALTQRDAKDENGHYQLLMLRGECQLQLDQRMEAIAAFEAAGKSA